MNLHVLPSVDKTISIYIHGFTLKTVRALLLVDRCVQMRVCSHGCDVMLTVSRLIKGIEDVFHVELDSSKHSEGLGELSKAMQTRDVNKDSCLDEAMQTGKKSSIA